MSQTIENPFAVPSSRRRSKMQSTSRLLIASKGLAMVAALFGFLVFAQAQSRRWLLERWVTGLADLPVAEQVERLLQIDALGDIATETVARRLAAQDDTVAATAYELLRERLSQWSVRDDASLGRAHQNMIAGLQGIVPELNGQRSRWAKELINQTLVECAERRVREMDDAYDRANQALALFPLSEQNRDVSDRATLASYTPSTTDATSNSVRPRLVPLPVRMQVLDQDVKEQVSAKASLEDAEIPLQVLVPSRSDTRIKQVTSQNSAFAVVNETDNNIVKDLIQPVRTLTQTSLETFNTKSVISLLGSPQADTRDQAVNELVRRGLSNEEIRLANQLASPIVEVRLGLLESITSRSDIDPRPWMLWLAEDSNREVRMRSISSLATMNDPAIKQALQKRFPQEHDPAVLAHLNRILSGQ